MLHTGMGSIEIDSAAAAATQIKLWMMLDAGT